MPDDIYFYEPAKGHGLPHDPFNEMVVGVLSELTPVLDSFYAHYQRDAQRNTPLKARS